ncbi:MAG: hypothetical protein E4H20_01315 [Spirochaetales bacterium]|nr:MAG: hypothetical protein E4H20_01315 [Spirochaetales bacterium]
MNTTQNIYAKYENETLAVNQFAMAHMGLEVGQTALKVDSYVVACAPFRFSLKGGMLLAVFSREELVFFQRYTNAMAGLKLVFQTGTATQPMKIFARCTLKSLSPMKGKDSIGLITVEWRPCPPDLLSIIGDYFLLMERLKVEHEDFKGKRIPINPVSSGLMGYNNYALASYEGSESKAAVFSIASDKLEFLLPIQAPALEGGKALQVKLFFRSYQFAIAGTVLEATRLPNGAQKVAASIGFSPELVDIIEHYRFSERFSIKSAAQGQGETQQADSLNADAKKNKSG